MLSSGALAVALLTTFCSRADGIAVEVNGRPVTIPTSTAKVGDLLAPAGVAARPGMVRSIVSGRPLLPNGNLAVVTLDGEPASLDTVMEGHRRVVTADGVDTVEAVEGRDTAGPLPGGAPAEEKALWRPGRPRVERSWVGVVSGEVVATMVVQPEAAAAPATGKVVALSFDDGPDATYTPQILEILKDEGVSATFCVVGTEARARPDLVKAEVAAGHTLCNHTVNHPNLSKRAADYVSNQLKTSTEILTSNGLPAPAVFRAPYGALSPTVIEAAHAQGMRVFGWSVDSIDYRRSKPDVLVRRVLDAVRPGSVILMHDGGGNRASTVAALRPIIQTLKARGYSFSTPTQYG